MPGTGRNVLRIVSAAAALVVLVAAGCGGSARPDPSATAGVPRALAGEWAAQASQVAQAAAAGDGCHASQLAAALRDQVIAEESKVPTRLRSPLLAGVNALADRIVCLPQTVTVGPKPKEPPKKPPPPPKKHHDDHKHHDAKQAGHG
jgi:hypothetical protein